MEVSKVMGVPGVPQFMDGLQYFTMENPNISQGSKWMIWGYPYFVLGHLHLQESVLWNSMVSYGLSMIFPLTPTQKPRNFVKRLASVCLCTLLLAFQGTSQHDPFTFSHVFTGRNDPGTKCHYTISFAKTCLRYVSSIKVGRYAPYG